MALKLKKTKKSIQHEKTPFKKLKDGKYNYKDAEVSKTGDEYIHYDDSKDDNDGNIKEELKKDKSRSMKRKYGPNNDEHFEPNTKKNKHSDTSVLNPVTVQELNQLRETENLFHSNLFRLQIQEMLKEIKIKSKHKSQFNQHWLNKLKTALEDIKDSEVYDISSPTLLQKLKTIPLKQINEVTGSFQFIKPANVAVVGSFGVNCCLGPTARIDVMVEMPKECFQNLDYKNHRYQWKRAMYLAYLAGELQQCDFVEGISFAHGHGNPLKPVLEMKPRGTLCNHVIVMHVSASQDSFKLRRFTPSNSNARLHWYFNEVEHNQELPPTPHLNNTFLEDLTMDLNNNYVKQVLEERTNLCDGIKLLKVWLRQRGLDQGYGSFGGHIMTMYVLYLLKSRRMNKLMSSYQVVRNTWNNLAQCDLIKNGITLTESSETQPPLSEFHQHFDVVFIDVSGFCNLCANMTKETFIKIKKESEMAVKCLDNPNINSFQALFMTPMPFYRQYDHIICIEDGSAIGKMVEEHSPRGTQVDYGGHVFPQALNLIVQLLRQGLGERISSLTVQLPAGARWAVDSEPPASSSGPILLGLTLNPEFALNVLDKGPPADSLEALDFRMFWGDRSELRRFQDGSISEAVVWPGEQTLARKRVICRQIVTYLLNTRLGLSDTMYVADELESLLCQTRLKPAGFEYGTGEEAMLAVINSFDSLGRQLRQLEDLPLHIAGVQGSSAVFRYTQVFPPLATNHTAGKKLTKEGANCLLLRDDNPPGKVPRWIPPIEAVIQLGMSSQWPKDLEAVRRLRAAFNIDIAKGLQKRWNLTAHPYTNYIDVLKDGFVFRIYVACDREISLMKQSTTPEGVVFYRDTEESLAVERSIFHQPKLTSALHGLHQQYPSLGSACCLAKRWLSSQLLDPHHFPEMCVELLMASLYLSPHPFQVPNQPQLGLFRFLNLLGRTDWNTVPVILNLNAEMERDEIVEIETRFQTSRASLPLLYIVTPYDRELSIWTKTAPTLQILIRAAQLALQALKVLEGQLFTRQIHCKQIFRPQLDVYDVLITLRPSLNPRRHEAVDCDTNTSKDKLDPYKHHPGEKIPVVDFNPVSLYLAELRANFDDYALFLHDCYGGNVIGVLWKPSAKGAKDFKVSDVNCHKLNGKGSKLVLNIDAIIEDFLILGDGLVKTIEQKKQ